MTKHWLWNTASVFWLLLWTKTGVLGLRLSLSHDKMDSSGRFYCYFIFLIIIKALPKQPFPSTDREVHWRLDFDTSSRIYVCAYTRWLPIPWTAWSARVPGSKTVLKWWLINGDRSNGGSSTVLRHHSSELSRLNPFFLTLNSPSERPELNNHLRKWDDSLEHH